MIIIDFLYRHFVLRAAYLFTARRNMLSIELNPV
jgi:hypothetical protein